MKEIKPDERLIHAPENYMSKRIMVGIPMTGLLRSEWVIARNSQVIPCNWSNTECYDWFNPWVPLQFQVADARNIISTECVEQGFEWLLFIDHDVILPQGALLRVNERILENEIPMWSGLYFTKSVPAEPLVYRGRGNSYYNKWKLGDEVWTDALPMGLTLIHSSILKVLYAESEEYGVKGRMVKRIFETPRRVWWDPEKNSWFTAVGTEDLEFCTRIMTDGIFKKAGWPKYQRKKFPFMVDTSLFCKHIDFDGNQYPMRDEHLQYVRE
jgi:hypothetical protein